MSEHGSHDQQPDQWGTRLPAFPWWRTCLLMLLLTGLAFGSEEAFWRSRGHRPSVTDRKELWHFWRSQVYDDDTIVLLGTSRMLGAFSSEAFGERFTHRKFVQLAIPGNRSPVGLLQQLLTDEQFQGVIICSVLPPGLMSSSWGGQVQWCGEPPQPADLWNVAAYSFLQDRFLILSSELSLQNRIRSTLGADSCSGPDYSRKHFDRTVTFDFSKIANLESLQEKRTRYFQREYRALEMPSPQSLLGGMAVVESMMRRLQDRGGQVVFVRLPSSGSHLKLEEYYHPKHEYWDQFAAATCAVCIHFQDVPTLRGFECPDNSHLDYRDARRFTRRLLHELSRRGVL